MHSYGMCAIECAAHGAQLVRGFDHHHRSSTMQSLSASCALMLLRLATIPTHSIGINLKKIGVNLRDLFMIDHFSIDLEVSKSNVRPVC